MVKVASRAYRLGSSITVDGAKTLADFLGERKTVSSRSKPTSHSLAVELPLHIGDREQVEGMWRLPPGTRLEHLFELGLPSRCEFIWKLMADVSKDEENTSGQDFLCSSEADFDVLGFSAYIVKSKTGSCRSTGGLSFGIWDRLSFGIWDRLSR
jgi:hypothetical protein